MKRIQLFLLLCLAIFQSSLSQTQEQLDDFKASSPIFQSRYYKTNVWDVQRSPAIASADVLWKLSAFRAPLEGNTFSAIDWGTSNNRYLKFDLIQSGSGNYIDDVFNSGNKFDIILKLYESDGTFLKNICSYGAFMGFGDKGFLFNQNNSCGTFFANDSYSMGSSIQYTPTTGMLTNLSQVSDYKYSPQVFKPTVSTTSFTYNGQQQGIVIASNSEYTITGPTSGVNVGTYTVTITLKDKVNNSWADGSKDDVVITWNIIKATYDMSAVQWNYTKPFIEDGTQKTVSVTGLPSGVTVNGYTGNSASNAGSYTATALLSYDEDNYHEPVIPELLWAISQPSKVAKPTVNTNSFIYSGGEQGISIGSNSLYTITGIISASNVGTYTVTIALNDKAASVWDDGTNDDVVITWSITKATYDMSSALWNYTEPFTWDGTQKTVSISGLPLGVTVYGYTDNLATNAGSYTATATLDYDKDNFHEPVIPELTWEIKPFGVAKPSVNASSFIYNGNEHSINIATSSFYSLTGVVSAVNVGTNTVTISLKDKLNNSWEDGSKDDVVISWSIAKATYDMSSARWDYTESFIWDGTQKTVLISGLPAGVTIYSYTGNTATNAGAYTAAALLSYDIDNYNVPVIPELSWTIKTIEVAKPSVNATSFVFNGDIQSIGLITNSSYTIAGVASAVNAGTYSATIALNDKVNSCWDDGTKDDVVITWSIAKATYDMSSARWDYTGSFIWDGTQKTVSLTGLPSGVTVNGYTDNLATNAGSHSAKASLDYDEDNYHEPIIPELIWEVKPFEVAKPSVNAHSLIYNGGEQGISLSVNSYYSSTGVVSAINVGTYTVTIALKDQVNKRWDDGTKDDVVITWSINKATYDMSTAHWDYTEPFTWGGTPKIVLVKGLPSGVTVNGYTGNSATDVGSYTATASLDYDEDNYHEPVIPSLDWAIKAGYVNLSIIKLWDNVLAVSNGEKYEDIQNATFRWYRDGVLVKGNQQYIRFEGTIPVGSYKVEILIGGDVAVTLNYTIAATGIAKAYPNPLQEGQSLAVEMGEERPDDEQVEVLSISGFPVKAYVERQISGYRISGLSSGTYLVRVFTPGQTTASLKIFVK